MSELIRRFLEGDGNPAVGRALLSALDDGRHHTLNFNLFDVTIDPVGGRAVFEDVLAPPDSETMTVEELRQLAQALADEGREDV